MAEAPTHVPRDTGTMRFARFIVRNRAYVAMLLIAFSLFFFYPIFNMFMGALGNPLPGPSVRIDTKARDLPSYPIGNIVQRSNRGKNPVCRRVRKPYPPRQKPQTC